MVYESVMDANLKSWTQKKKIKIVQAITKQEVLNV